MKLNNKGFGLLETMMCLFIMMITMWAMLDLLAYFNKSIAAGQKRIDKGIANRQIPLYAAANEPSSKEPLLCIGSKSNNDFVLACTPNVPCTFTGGKWVRGNNDCNGGILFR